MTTFKPFENDTQSITVGSGNGLTFENGKETINIYGDLEINKNSDVKEIDDIINMLIEVKKAIENRPAIKLK